jgi:2-(1,2-epoxy-1,2-dihydrophenyl)acetyl-CoA isomerase
MTESILLERQNGVATVTLNRPAALNAMDVPMAERLIEVLQEIERDSSLRAVILTGAGRAFLAGGDINTMVGLSQESPAVRQRAFEGIVRAFNPIALLLRRLPQPVIARVNGAAAGFGLTLVMACDLAIASQDANFSLAYARIGTTPDGGASWFLPRAVGAKRAAELALFGDRIDASEALALGLVNHVVPAQELEQAVDAMAQRLTEGPTIAHTGIKRLLNASETNALESQLEAETSSFARCAATSDFAEAVQAFMTKRQPEFKGQ